MKRFLLSYDIIADKCTEREVWDAMYEMKGWIIEDKPVLSTLLLQSQDELMHIKIAQRLKEKFKGLYFIVCRIDERKKEDGKIVDCYWDVPNPESQKQIKEYLKEKNEQK